jgi:hypothetical protein
MNIYILKNPSDMITFVANNDKIAFMCALLVGRGRYGCENLTTKEEIPTMLFLCTDPDNIIKDFIEIEPKQFLQKNKQEIKNCLNTFAYVSFDNRANYDNKCNSITKLDNLQKFKIEHENKNRTSMNRIVLSAWRLSEEI